MKQIMRGIENCIKLLFEKLKEKYHTANTKENGRVVYKHIIKFEGSKHGICFVKVAAFIQFPDNQKKILTSRLILAVCRT